MNRKNVLTAVRSMAAVKGKLTEDVIRSCIGGLSPEELDFLEKAFVISLRELGLDVTLQPELMLAA